MRRSEATAWVAWVCAVSLRLSQAEALAALVASAMRVERVSPANLGRQMVGTAKHQIKWCRRFCNNDRVEPADATRGVVGRLARGRKKPPAVAPDRVDVRGYQTPAASAVPEGRSVPLCRASCEGHTYAGHRSRRFPIRESRFLLGRISESPIRSSDLERNPRATVRPCRPRGLADAGVGAGRAAASRAP